MIIFDDEQKSFTTQAFHFPVGHVRSHVTSKQGAVAIQTSPKPILRPRGDGPESLQTFTIYSLDPWRQIFHADGYVSHQAHISGCNGIDFSIKGDSVALRNSQLRVQIYQLSTNELLMSHQGPFLPYLSWHLVRIHKRKV